MSRWRWLAAAASGLAGAATAGEVSMSRSIESAQTQATVHEVVVPAGRAAVWQAISTAQGWRTWAAPAAWNDARDPAILETSYDPAASPGNGRTITQRIVLAVPERLFAFRTIKPADDFRDFEALAPVSWVFELEPDGPDRTRVRLTGSGYPRTAAGDRIRTFFEQGNSVALQFLRQRFERGPLDWQAQLGKAQGVKQGS